MCEGVSTVGGSKKWEIWPEINQRREQKLQQNCFRRNSLTSVRWHKKGVFSMYNEVFLYYNRGTASHGLTVSIILFFKLLQNSVAYVKGNIDEWRIIIYSSFFIINASQATVFENPAYFVRCVLFAFASLDPGQESRSRSLSANTYESGATLDRCYIIIPKSSISLIIY